MLENISKHHYKIIINDKLFELLKNYKNYFNFKNIKILLEYENENYVINSILDTKPSYNLFYIFFKIELDVLKDYLLKNLILNRIQEFISRTNVFVLFVFKKTIIFNFMSIIKR